MPSPISDNVACFIINTTRDSAFEGNQYIPSPYIQTAPRTGVQLYGQYMDSRHQWG